MNLNDRVALLLANMKTYTCKHKYKKITLYTSGIEWRSSFAPGKYENLHLQTQILDDMIKDLLLYTFLSAVKLIIILP